jgi:L,D-transpeptidase ErfK/SrfK
MNSFVYGMLVALQLVGGDWTYTVRDGDSLTSIGARFGVDTSAIAKDNLLQNTSPLETGQTLRMDNRHIVPPASGAEIVVNVPQRMLFLFRDGVLRKRYPVGAGKPTWPTPLGPFEIISAETDPVWDVPASIQAEMSRQGKAVVTKVAPGPSNPLGKYWLGLSLSGIGIHGTNAPSSVYGLASHGCIRLHPDDIQDLFLSVKVGSRGVIIYEPVLILHIGEAVFLEAHPDAYRMVPDSLQAVRAIAEREGFSDLVDWDAAADVLRRREGVAREVTLRER